jgi:GNAT superfamily N-acetyltransferase
MTFSVRPGTLADQAAVAGVRVETWRSAYAGIVPDAYLAAMDPDALAARRVAWYPDRPESDVDFVALVDGEVAGFVHGGRYRDEDRPTPDALEVYALYVRPAAQGRGLGTALLEAATSVLTGAPVLLWVLAANAPSRRFYERHGFLADGVTHTYQVGGAVLPEVRYRLSGRD